MKRVKGKDYPHVTDILRASIKNPFLDAMERNDPERLKYLGDQGSAFHEITSWYDLKMPASQYESPRAMALYSLYPILRQAVEHYIAWSEKNIKRVLWTEKPVFHDGYRYQGRADLGAVVVGRPGIWIIDKKITASVYPEVELQTAGYALALEAKGGKTWNRAALWFKRNDESVSEPKFIPHERENDRAVFAAMTIGYKWMVYKNIVKPKIRED